MMKLRTLAVLFFSAALALSVGCGGGGGGDNGGGGGGLATGGFVKTPSDVAGINGTFFSVNTERWQMLYMASDIAGAGNIKSMELKYGTDVASAVTCTGATVNLSNSNLTNLSATFAGNLDTGQGGQKTVLQDRLVSMPADSAGTWHAITFSEPFYYNGVDNLIVEIILPYGCTGGSASIAHDAAAGYNSVAYGTAAAVSGTVAPYLQNTKFNFSGGENKLDFGGTGSNSFPFNTNQRHVQLLYLADEINGSGPITGIGMKVSALTTEATYTYTVKLGHTTLSALTNDYAANFDSGSPTTVANSATFTIPAGVPVDEYVWIPVAGSFNYNGTDNLIVDIEVPNGTALNYWRNNATYSTSRRLYGIVGNATGTVDDFTYETMLRFNGGPMVKNSGHNNANNAIFTGANPTWSTATLYRATELGSPGNITSVGCRLYSATTATIFANFKVVMGHSNVSQLSVTTADNFIQQKTVFNGTYTVPANLKVGDWVMVPLSSSFAYDGKSNLVVWMGNNGSGAPGTSQVLWCMAEDNASRYPNGMGHAATGVGDATFLGMYNWTTDLRFTITR